jgi:cell division protein FtsQ
VGNHTILLGNIDNYERKLESVLALYNQAMPDVGWDAYEVISVKYKDQIVCTRRDKKYRHDTWTKKTLPTYE